MIRPAILIRGKVNLSKIVEYPALEDIEVTPTKEDQILKSEKYGFNEVIVKGDENLDPNNIISSKSIYGVQGANPSDVYIGLADIAGTGSFYQQFQSNVNRVIQKVNFANVDLTGKTSLKNLLYNCGRLNEAVIDMKGIIDAYGLFERCSGLKSGSVKLSNTQDLEDGQRMFYDCTGLTETVEFDTSSLKNIVYMYRGCKNITLMKHMDFSSVTNGMNTIWADLPNLRTIESITGIGKGYTEKTEHYSAYDVILYNASYLDAASVLKVIEGLADLNEVYDVANGGTLYRQNLRLGTAHKSKVTAAQKQIAIDKGWTVTE